jgi:hypothetical protein
MQFLGKEKHYLYYFLWQYDQSDAKCTRLRALSSYTSQNTVTITAIVFSKQAYLVNHICANIQSQSYFTTGGLPSISSSWCQAP